MANTARGAFPYPIGSDPADGPAAIQALATQNAALNLLGGSGTLAARPTPGASDVDRYYFATDNGLLYRWSGTAWSTVNPLALTDQAVGVGSQRTLGTGALQAAPGNDARFTDMRTPSGTFASRPAAGTANRFYRATDTKMLYMDTGTEWLPVGGTAQVDSTAPLAYNAAWPASPVDGQIVLRYADASNTFIWMFRYVAANGASVRWVFIGGPPLLANPYAGSLTTVTTPLNGTQYLCAGSTPHFICPAQGKYIVELQIITTNPNGTNWQPTTQFIASATATVSSFTTKPAAWGGIPQTSGQSFLSEGSYQEATFVAGTSYNLYFGCAGVQPSSVNFWVGARITPIALG